MKLIRFGTLCFLFALLTKSAAALGGPFQAGAFAIDISPRVLPAIRNGGFLERADDRVDDPLHARCLVLADGKTKLAIAVVDSCMIPRDVCDAIKARVERQAGIPAEVLYAVALQESALPLRGQLRPWPWTLNVAGRPLRFASQPAACQALHRALATTPPTRIDIGLAQINWGYHGQRFASPCAALQPTRNLRVATQLLREQHRRSGDWLRAAGHYHRPAGGAPAARYRQGVARHLARLKFPLPPATEARP